MSEPKAIILDFDGVILESADIKTQAFVHLFEGHPPHVVNAIVQHHLDNVGLSRYEKLKYIYPAILKRPLGAQEMEELSRRFAEYVVEPVRACPEVEGATEFLRVYSKRCLLFVASGTPEEELRELAQARGLSRFFTAVFGSPATKSQICASILRQWHLQPAEAVFVGDSLTDFREASRTGVPFIGRVRPGEETFKGLEVPTVENLRQLRRVLESGFLIIDSDPTKEEPEETEARSLKDV